MINILTGIDSTYALNAERIRMDVVSLNIANVNTTRGLKGPTQALRHARQRATTRSYRPRRTTGRPARLAYQPGHPDADGNGMVDLMASSRSYEANLSAVKTARSMALQTLAIGKR